jgi:hypothetical protein
MSVNDSNRDKERDKKTSTIRESDLSTQQNTILDERMSRYENGLMEFSVWEEAHARIISKRAKGV